jgi:hypothetical protein
MVWHYLRCRSFLYYGGHPNEVKEFNIVGTAGAEYELVDYPISFLQIGDQDYTKKIQDFIIQCK